MSAIALANLLNQLNAAGRAFLAEAETTITTSNLSLADAREILTLTSQLGWCDRAYDGAGSEWSSEELPADFFPFRVHIRKPNLDEDELLLLTNVGFSHWLKTGHSANKWYVVGLSEEIRTCGRVLLPFGNEAIFETEERKKSPRTLVREYAAQRIVTDDIRPWLLSPNVKSFQADPITHIWANLAFKELLISLADEVDAEDSSLKFKGPPRLSLSLPIPDIDFGDEKSWKCFFDLQQATSWVYENEREAELKHILLATELARSGDGHEGAFNCIGRHISAALDGAKVAYQMSLSELGRDTLKALADLRKAVTEETAKVTEATRQLVAAIASSIAVGLGLIAARATTNTYSWLIFSIIIVIIAYVAVVIFSGDRFISLQRQLRKDWQPKLYRFLPQEEYQKMVEAPARQAERTFFWVSVIGGAAVLILAATIACNLTPDASKALPKSGESKSEINKKYEVNTGTNQHTNPKGANVANNGGDKISSEANGPSKNTISSAGSVTNTSAPSRKVSTK